MSTTIQALRDDWDFAHELSDYATHCLHPYPARMPPSLTRKLILEFSSAGDLVFDPFCGSGTVLVEASLCGRRSFGSDINPLAVLVAKAKTTPIPESQLSSSFERVLRLLQEDEKLHLSKVQFTNVDYWFKKQVQGHLTKLRAAIETIRDPDVRRFFKVCFSATVREVSNTRQGEFKPWRLPKEELRSHRPNVYEVFSRIVLDGFKMVVEYKELLAKQGNIDAPAVVLSDARSLSLRKESVNLVLTSPPYGDSITTVAYGQFCKFSSLWVGLPRHLTNRLDQNSLGGRLSSPSTALSASPTLSRTLAMLDNLGSSRGAGVMQFFADVAISLDATEKCLRPGGIMCLVVGNRTVSRVRLPTAEILEEYIGSHRKLRHESTYERRIPFKTLPWANAPENLINHEGETISREFILVFSKK